MSIIILYVVYIIVFVLAFFIFWYLTDIINAQSLLLSLFLASIIGIVVVFIGFIWLNNSNISDDDQIALAILLIIAFGIPIFLVFFIFYAKEQCNIIQCAINQDCLNNCVKPCIKEPDKLTCPTESTIT